MVVTIVPTIGRYNVRIVLYSILRILEYWKIQRLDYRFFFFVFNSVSDLTGNGPGSVSKSKKAKMDLPKKTK
jgi:hypothetical protein